MSSNVFTFGTLSVDKTIEILNEKTQHLNLTPIVKPNQELQDSYSDDTSDSASSCDLQPTEPVQYVQEWSPNMPLSEFWENSIHSRNDIDASLLGGIYNKAATCYFNCIMQTLVHCKPFWNVLKMVESIISQDETTQSQFKSQYPMLYELYCACSQLLNHKKHETVAPAVDLIDYLQVLNSIDPNSEFYGTAINKHHDAQEFFLWMTDLLDKEQAKVQLTFNTVSNDDAGSDNDDGWQEVSGKGNSASIVQVGDSFDHDQHYLMSKIFGGITRSSIQKSTVTAQSFRCIHLEVQNKCVRSIQDGLELFFAPEYISTTGGAGAQMKQRDVTLDVLPQVLVLHLMRFAYDPYTGMARKVGKSISYGETLDIPARNLSARLKKELEMQNKPKPTYKLISVVQHHGAEAIKGHYTATIKDQFTKKWYYFDDDRVVEDCSPVKDCRNAYLLFYELQ